MTDDIKILRRLYDDYTKKYLKKIILSVFFTLLLAGSTSAIAYLLDPAIKKLFIEQKKDLILVIPGLIILAFVVKGISLYLAKVIMIGVSAEVTKDMQIDVFNSILNADTKLIENKHSGKFITNMSNNVAMITNLVSTVILNLFKDSLTLLGLLSVMFYQNWKLTLFAIIMIPVASIAAKSLGKRIGKVTKQQMDRAGLLNTYLLEILKNHKLAKIFQKEKFEKNRAINLIEDVKESSKKISIVFVRASPIMEILTGVMIALLIYLSANLISSNEIDVGNFFSFMAAMMLAYQPVRSLATLNIAIQQGLTGARNILPLIDHTPEIQDKKDSKDLVISEGSIDFENVNFHYSTKDSNVLNSVSLKIPGKKMTALIGHSGAGKSTILNLIPRFYDANSGDIKIDNQSIYDSSIHSLRKNISLVSQDTTLFDDTIFNNIAYANKNASIDKVKLAAKYSFANEFIDKLPNGYNTHIGENGIRLSGGEKQRLSIARAILKEASIILLDEATSSLDADTESKIQKAINFLTKGRTTVVIAHRLSTILNSDMIYIIDKGKVIDQGKHGKLIIDSPTYKNFYEKQLKRSE
jgi:subfamily B ATP-binding cassette protein MsbA